MNIEGMNGSVIIGGKEVAKIEQWSVADDGGEPMPRYHQIQQMPTAQLLGLWGSKTLGWSLAQLELSRRGIKVNRKEMCVIVDMRGDRNITKSLHTLKSEVVQKWGRLCKSLKFKGKKRAHPQNTKKG